jgi:cytochrome P450
VAKALAWTTYYLLENPEKLTKLREELNRLDRDHTATMVDLEKMPYLVSPPFSVGESIEGLMEAVSRHLSCSKG